jgi:hypothetical protein
LAGYRITESLEMLAALKANRDEQCQLGRSMEHGIARLA